MVRYRAWLQGTRLPEGPVASDWREVLFGRLERDYRLIEQGEKTRQAENGLGFQASAYFFAGRCEPSFGDSAILFDASEVDAASVTPFDTGGLWFDHIRANPNVRTECKGDFVRDSTFDAPAGQEAYEGWINTNFANCDDYTRGVIPSIGCHIDVIIVDGSDSRCWVWECRIPRELISSAPITPARMVLKRARYEHYKNWLIFNNKVSDSVKRQHLSTIADIYLDPGEAAPGQFINNWLCQEE